MVPPPDTNYSHQSTAERLISSGRAILGGFLLLAIWLDPSEPSRFASLTYSILAGYVGYALILAFLTRRRLSHGSGLQLVTHAIDMLVFAVLVFFTRGTNSPFFVYFIFLLVCAALRWQWRGTLWTAAVALALTVAMAWYPINLLLDQDFEQNRFIIRILYLTVVAMLLGYLGAHEAKLRKILSRMAASPRSTLSGLPELAQEILKHAHASSMPPASSFCGKSRMSPGSIWRRGFGESSATSGSAPLPLEPSWPSLCHPPAFSAKTSE